MGEAVVRSKAICSTYVYEYMIGVCGPTYVRTYIRECPDTFYVTVTVSTT